MRSKQDGEDQEDTVMNETEFKKLLDNMSTEDLLKFRRAVNEHAAGRDVKQKIKIGSKGVAMTIELFGEFMKLTDGKKADWIYPVSKAFYELAKIGG